MSLKAVLLFLAFSIFRPNLAQPYFYEKIHDITVSNDNGTIQCDQIKCPAGTERCRVVKHSLYANLSKLKRNNTCFDGKGNILKEESWSEENINKNFVSITVETNPNGTVSSYSESESYEYTSGIDDAFTGIGHSVGILINHIADFINNIFHF